MIRIEIKKCNTILTENQQKYHHYLLEKLINMNILEVLPSNQKQIIEQAKFACSPLGKAFEKQTEKQAYAIKPLDPSNKLKQIGSIFLQTLWLIEIRPKLKETVELQDIIKKDDLNDNSKHGKTYNFSKYSLPIGF